MTERATPNQDPQVILRDRAIVEIVQETEDGQEVVREGIVEPVDPTPNTGGIRPNTRDAMLASQLRGAREAPVARLRVGGEELTIRGIYRGKILSSTEEISDKRARSDEVTVVPVPVYPAGEPKLFTTGLVEPEKSSEV